MTLPSSSQWEIERYKELLPRLESEGFDFSQEWICDYVVREAGRLEGIHWSGVASLFVELCQMEIHEPLFRVLVSDTVSGDYFRQVSPLLEAGEDFLLESARGSDRLLVVA